MGKIESLFYQILISLNEHKYNKVRKLAKETHLKYEIIGCDKIISVTFNDHVGSYFYHIAFVLNKETGFYQVIVPDRNNNLFNTIPQLLVDQGVSTVMCQDDTDLTKHYHSDHHKHKQDKDIRGTIVVLMDYDATAAVERAMSVFHIQAKIVRVNASNIVEITEQLIKKGYRYFVGPSFSSNIDLLSGIIHKYPNVKFISPLSTLSNVVSKANLLRLNIDNAQYATVVTNATSKVPFLILAEDDPNAIDLANKIAALAPGSVVAIIHANSMYIDTLNAINANPTLTNVFFSFSTFGQNYFNAISSIVFAPTYVFWTNDALQLENFTWNHNIYAFRPGYLPTVLKSLYFGDIGQFDYLYVEALYYFQQYIDNGFRPLAGVTGVIEFDEFGDRIWTSYQYVMYNAGSLSVWSILFYYIIDPITKQVTTLLK